MSTLLLKNGTLLDGINETPGSSGSILIEDGVIRSITEQTSEIEPSAREKANIIDLTGKFVIPGLIDAHVHLCALEQETASLIGEVRSSETALALAGANNCQQALQNGVTTLRDLGAPGYINIKLRTLVQAGLIPGPDIIACGYALAMTGGHGTPGISYEIDGPHEAAKAVRLMRKMGADCIKLMANGLSVNSPELNLQEMRAAVETAHDAGLKVAAHASVWRAVENAVDAGVDTIEHGYTLNEAIIEKMLEKDIILVPTLGTVTQVARIGDQFPHWQDKMDAIRARLQTALKSFTLAREMGVRFAMGTDGSSWPLLRVGEVFTELESMQQIGFSNLELLQSATNSAAAAVDRSESIGSLTVGKDADILVLNSSPLQDLKALKDIFMVIKKGAIIDFDHTINTQQEG